MKNILLCLLTALLLALLLFGTHACTSTRPPSTPPFTSAPLHIGGLLSRDSAGRRVDSVVVEPHRSLVDKVLGRNPHISTYQPPRKDAEPPYKQAEPPYKIGRKSTVSIYYAPATVTTNTAAKKATILGAGAVLAEKKATAAKADSGSTLQVAATQKGPAAAAGHDASAPETTVKPGLWPAIISGLGLLGGIGLVYWLVLGGGAAWLLAAWRRKKNDTA